MQLDDADSELLKKWIEKKLADISDADSEILSDYVLALVNTEDPDDVVRVNCVSNLQDFLEDSTEPFVDEIFTAIKTKSFDPSKPALSAPIQPLGSRKRGLEEDYGAHNGRIQSFEGGDRPLKQPRRGGARGGYEGRGGRFGQVLAHQHSWQPPHVAQMPQFQQNQMSQMPVPPPGMPPFDPNNPMSMFMAMQAMGMPSMPGMPGAPPPTQKHRCHDYDNKGFCSRGAACPYEHGEDAVVVPQAEEYDPSNSALPGMMASNNGYPRGGTRGRGRGRGAGNFRGGGRRAEISHLGPNFDQSNTTIVVEQIPEDKFDKQTVRDFFGQHGDIEEVSMQPYKRLATVKYNSYESAKAAYDSPKVIFDNRFVKVYWYKMDNPKMQSTYAGGDDVEMKEEQPQIDTAEVARRQEEAQRKHEESMKQRATAEQRRSEIDAKLKAMESERAKMAERLVKKSTTSSNPAASSPAANGTSGENEKTRGLKDQLAKLEAEAKILGIDPASTTNSWASSPSYRGRGDFHGRGGFAPRGRGWNPGYRGGWNAGGRGGAVKRLDNRPRTVSIVFPSGTYDQHGEALRQYLLLTDNLDHAILSKHPERADAALLAFEERYRAENFMAAAGSSSGIPHIGSVELAWQANAPIAVSNGADGHDQQHVSMSVGEEVDEPAGVADTFDVADDW